MCAYLQVHYLQHIAKLMVNMMCTLHFLGFPSIPWISPPEMCSNLMCTVTWTASGTTRGYKVTWINLNTTDITDNFTVFTNTYTITGLSANETYTVSVTAVGTCGEMTSDSITVYGECACDYSYVCICI